MDLLLRLPSLKLIASSHKDMMSNAFDISLTLQSLSVCFYSPHQVHFTHTTVLLTFHFRRLLNVSLKSYYLFILQPSPLDALALTLDKFAAVVSPTSMFLHDNSHLKVCPTYFVQLFASY